MHIKEAICRYLKNFWQIAAAMSIGLFYLVTLAILLDVAMLRNNMVATVGLGVALFLFAAFVNAGSYYMLTKKRINFHNFFAGINRCWHKFVLFQLLVLLLGSVAMIPSFVLPNQWTYAISTFIFLLLYTPFAYTPIELANGKRISLAFKKSITFTKYRFFITFATLVFLTLVGLLIALLPYVNLFLIAIFYQPFFILLLYEVYQRR